MNSAIPWPRDPETAARWVHQRAARMILYSNWEDQLKTEVTRSVGKVRGDVWRILDMSANQLKSTANQLARLYDAVPAISNDDKLGDELADKAQAAALWLMRARVHRDTIALREAITNVSVIDGELVYRQVDIDKIVAVSSPDNPHKVVRLEELRLREIEGKEQWTWDVWDVSGDVPKLTVENTKRTEDITALVLGATFEGDDYIWRVDGKPVIPYVIHHASWSSELFDWRDNSEIISGVKQLAVYLSFFGHTLRNASWPQRYAVNAKVAGTDEESHVIADPTAILMLSGINDTQPSVGMWGESADALKMLEAITKYAASLSAHMGINASDLVKTSGDPRSGYAVAVSRESQRELMRRLEPTERFADLEILKLSAAFLGAATGTAYPTTGYRIKYRGIPESLAERKAKREEVYKDLELGLITKEQAYLALNPDTKTAGLKLVDAAVTAATASTATSTDEKATADNDARDKGPAPTSAMNGAQVTAAVAIVQEVAAGTLPVSSGLEMLQLFFKLTKDEAKRLLS